MYSLVIVLGASIISAIFLACTSILSNSVVNKWPSENLSLRYFTNATFVGIFAFASGYLAAWIPFFFEEPIAWSAQAVTGLVILNGIVSFFLICDSVFEYSEEKKPVWFYITLFVISTVCIIRGGSKFLPTFYSVLEQLYFLFGCFDALVKTIEFLAFIVKALLFVLDFFI